MNCLLNLPRIHGSLFHTFGFVLSRVRKATEEQPETRFEINQWLTDHADLCNFNSITYERIVCSLTDGKNGFCFLCRSLNLGFSASVKFHRCGFLTLIFLCDQGERGAAGLDGRSGLDGKPGVPGPPGQRVGDSCHFYLNMNRCYMCVTNTVFWLLWYRGILGKQVILGEM